MINAGGKITAKTSGDDAYGVAANMAGSAINASGDINIVTGGARGYGFYIKENGRVTGGEREKPRPAANRPMPYGPITVLWT